MTTASTVENACFVVAAHERADLLRLQVVGVVVAGAQHVGAEHDPALDLRAEALASGLLVHLLEIPRAFGAEAVAHAVVAREVRARLGGGDDVVRGDRVGRVRQLDVCRAPRRARARSRAPRRSSR